jgi:hypothetical protein
MKKEMNKRTARFFGITALAAGLLAACGGGDGGSEPPPNDGSPALTQASKPGELTSYLQRKLRERAQLRAAGGSTGDVPTTVALPPGAAPLPSSMAGNAQRSATLTQEEAVDEPDLLKTDGSRLYSVDGQDQSTPRLRVHQRADSGAISEIGSLALQRGDATALHVRGLMLGEAEKAVVAGGMAWTVPDNPCADLCPPTVLLPGPVWLQQNVVVQRIDVSDPARPASTVRLEFDGRWIDARRIGRHLVLVTEYRPMLGADVLPATASAEEREAAIARTQAADALPRLRVTDAAGATRRSALVEETQCFVQPANASTDIAVTTITVLDLAASALAPQSRCFIGGSEAMYMTEAALYLASTRWSYRLENGIWHYPDRMKTDIHKFGFSAGTLAYRGSGEVDGHLGWDAERKSYRLSEHEGNLRVLSFTGGFGWVTLNDRAGGTPPSPATLTVLRETAGALQALAKLPNERRPQALGKPGEQVHGVRFVGTRGYLVTFRQIDPLYVLDLADATDPRIAGVLEVPGFSDHLVPLPNNLLLGVGKDATPEGRLLGVKVSLLDVADAAAPRELASARFGSTGSTSALDVSRNGMSLLAAGSVMRAALPLHLLDANFSNARDGLQRLEVDTAARTLLAKPLIAPPAGAPAFADLGAERTVQIGAHVYWLRAGQLSAHAW